MTIQIDSCTSDGWWKNFKSKGEHKWNVKGSQLTEQSVNYGEWELLWQYRGNIFSFSLQFYELI